MTKQIVILGKCGPKTDAKALEAAVRFVAETQPDELVIFEQSTRLLELLREVYDGCIGAHTDHPDTRFAVTGLPAVHDIAPGWVSTPADDDYPASDIAGNTALHAAKRRGTCVVLGHTGCMGIASYSFGYGGTIAKTVAGMELGHLMDRKLGRPLGGQQGYGTLTIEGQHVEAAVVPISS